MLDANTSSDDGFLQISYGAAAVIVHEQAHEGGEQGRLGKFLLAIKRYGQSHFGAFHPVLLDPDFKF
ncbi:hypothetical protein EIP86_009055 [Pleurotus ostreatoroseus]|nr:hypothetical protein EIP86_009055 [Pleurotus ostreatoroseus]